MDTSKLSHNGNSHSSTFSFLRNFHTVFHIGSTNLNFHLRCTQVPFPPHSLQHLSIVDVLTIAILTGVRWELILVLIYVSLIISNVEHFFMCLLAILMSSLEKYLFGSSAHFLKAFCFFVFKLYELSACFGD